MTTTRPRRPPPRARTTVPLTGTHAQTKAYLSFEADLALKYAALWLAQAGSPKAPASGVMRRALSVYMDHLTTAEPRSEAAAVRRACTTLPTSEEEQQLAAMRLYATPPGEALPSFRDVVSSPQARREMQAFTARSEALADRLIANLPGFKRKRLQAQDAAESHPGL